MSNFIAISLIVCLVCSMFSFITQFTLISKGDEINEGTKKAFINISFTLSIINLVLIIAVICFLTRYWI